MPDRRRRRSAPVGGAVGPASGPATSAPATTQGQAQATTTAPGSATPALDAAAPATELRSAVNERVSQTITNATPGFEAWNNTYGWDSKFDVVVDPLA